MSVHTAAPLPECSLCEAPTRRAAYEANGGLCDPCAGGVADTVRMLPVGRGLVDVEQLRRSRLLARGIDPDADLTVHVERWLPPVPRGTE